MFHPPASSGWRREKCIRLYEVEVVMSSQKGTQLEWGTVGEQGKEIGEGKGRGEVSSQATWDQSGQGSHHTQRRVSK